MKTHCRSFYAWSIMRAQFKIKAIMAANIIPSTSSDSDTFATTKPDRCFLITLNLVYIYLIFTLFFQVNAKEKRRIDD